MPTYRELYMQLFRALRDATSLLERGDIISALEVMIAAQRAGEDAHLDTDILPED